jgi:hypothetical protein
MASNPWRWPKPQREAIVNRFSSLITAPILSAAGNSSAHRVTTIAVSVLLLATPAWAQRGGAGARGAGVGARAGISGHVGGGNLPGARSSRPGSSAGFSRRPANRSRNRLQSSRRRNRFPNCWGYGCWGWASPWWAYSPFWWGGYNPYDDSRDRDDDSPQTRDSFQDAQTTPPWGYGYPYPYPPPPQAAPGSAASQPPTGTPIIPAIVLVFRDQHKQEIESYAIVGQTLWNFSSQHIEKISLTELDLAATVKANNERGRSFRVPSSAHT